MYNFKHFITILMKGVSIDLKMFWGLTNVAYSTYYKVNIKLVFGVIFWGQNPQTLQHYSVLYCIVRNNILDMS